MDPVAMTVRWAAGCIVRRGSKLDRTIGTGASWRRPRFLRRRRLVAAVSALTLVCALTGPADVLAAGDVNRPSCPAGTESSPGFRSYLPDCRAYEFVTPPYTDGFPVNMEVEPQEGLNGDRMLFNSFGTFAETPGSPAGGLFGGPLYLASRGPTGWTTVSVTPPVARFSSEAVSPSNVLANAAGTTAVWPLRDLTEPDSHTSAYLRDADGTLRLLGPATPFVGKTSEAGPGRVPLPGAVAANLSRIALETSAVSGQEPYLWSGDASLPSQPSLYEYDLGEPGIGTTSSEPKLVGVKNEGRLASNDEAQQISQCGTVLGGGSNRHGGAISDDGTYLYLTADSKTTAACKAATQPFTNEIYARLDGEHTVPISEPTAEDCAACLQGAEREAAEDALTVAQSAVFQGASSDGTKVFFTSFQELLPGIKAGGTTPNLYRFDFNGPVGQRLQLVSLVPSGSAEVQAPPVNYSGIAADGERAYFVAKSVLTTEANVYGKTAEAGKLNLYVWEAGGSEAGARIGYIATVASNVNPIATADGRFAVFVTEAQITPGDTSTAAQLFEYDTATGALVRVSVGDLGFNENGNTGVNPVSRPFISADGRRVFFQSSKALTPGALDDQTNTVKNIYEWEWSGNQPSELAARVFLISDGQSTKRVPLSGSEGFGAALLGIDETGTNVYFDTVGALVPQDTDTQAGIYDARVNGGFPPPAAQAVCEGDACQGAPATAPKAPTAGSRTYEGTGNGKFSNHKHCAKGKVLRHRKCVRRRHRHIHRHHRRHKSQASRHGRVRQERKGI